MANKNITTVNEISSVDDSDKVFVNDGNTLKQITVINLMKKAPASSGGGTTDYNDLTNQPQLNGVTLEGNKTLDQIGAVQAKIEALEKMAETYDKEKADNIVYEDNKLQLTSNGEKIGDAATIATGTILTIEE